MRILFLTPQLPYPPEKGTALRNWGLLSGLAARHEVALLSFLDPGQVNEPVEVLRTTCVRVEAVTPPARSLRSRLRDLVTTRQADMAIRLASEVFAGKLRDWLREDRYDIVHVEGIELAPYLPLIESADPRPLIVFDDHNCEYLLQQRVFVTDLRAPARWPGAAYSFVQWRRLRRLEEWACRRADRVLAVSEADAAALHRLVPDVTVTVIPNGIDTVAYRPKPAAVSATPEMVFTGTMDFRPNVDAVLWFARKVLPRVKAAVPEVRFSVVGQRPHRRLDMLRVDPAVTLTGWVEDPRPYIARASVYVAPLRMGGGTRLKLLEAMAMGKAVVATRLGAEGFPVQHERELLLADTPEEFAEAVVGLLRSPERREELGRAGRRFVEQGYDWRVIVPRVEAVYGDR
jgi:sugar transferase (PEP-CTERM/EpsH1 system associated)